MNRRSTRKLSESASASGAPDERQRHVLHVDMDAFYASVEKLDNPELKNEPVLVGGAGPRGVVAAASYEARKHGARSAMPMRRALQLCPNATVIRPRISRYQQVSAVIFSIFREITPIVEGLSLDEAFLDISDRVPAHGQPLQIARRIKERILADTGLTASVGIGPNKLVAKIASDLEKPDGLCEVRPENFRKVLDPLPIEALFGIGPKTAVRLHRTGVKKFRDLRTADDASLVPVFGRYAQRMRERAAGIDRRPVGEDAQDKSVSAEETFDQDIGDRKKLHHYLMHMTERISKNIQRKGWVASQLNIKVRLPDFTTLSRQKSLQPPANGCRELQLIAAELLGDWLDAHPGAELRLLGVGVSGLGEDRQLDLFPEGKGAKNRKLDRLLDQVADRFGDAALQRGQHKIP